MLTLVTAVKRSPGGPEARTCRPRWEMFVEAAFGVGPEGYQLVHAPVCRWDPLCAICRAMGHQAEARMVRSFSRSILAMGCYEQQPVGRARRVFPARPQRAFEDARDLLRRWFQYQAFLLDEGPIDHRARFRRGCDPARQTIRFRAQHHLHQAGYEFKDKEDLRRFFTPHFKFARVWDTIYPTRHNPRFVASQTPVEMYG